MKYTKTDYYSDCCFSMFSGKAAWSMQKDKLKSDLHEACKGAEEEIPGVTESYSYFGTKNSTSTGHAEDCNLFSLNYLHFGAPKQWVFITEKGKDDFER
jgi:hypothetical protein